jgi:hypothetical protein
MLKVFLKVCAILQIDTENDNETTQQIIQGDAGTARLNSAVMPEINNKN